MLIKNLRATLMILQKFQSVIERKKDETLPMVHINFSENVFQNLSRQANKIKVSVKKLSKLFGFCSGVIECISKDIAKNFVTPLGY